MKKHVKRLIKLVLYRLSRLSCKIKHNEFFENVNWLDKISKAYLRFLKIFSIYPLKIFLNDYIKEIQNNMDENKISLFIDNIVNNFKKLNDESKLIAFYLLYYMDLIDEKTMQIFMNFAKSTDNKYYRYYITMDVSKLAFFSQKCFYDNFYIDRKNLLIQICLENDLTIPAINNKNDDNKRKLCIISFCAEPTIFNSTQRVTEMFVNGLKDKFDEILVLPLDAFSVSMYERGKIVTQFENPFSIKYKKKLEKIFTGNTKIKFVPKKDLKDRLQETLEIIYNFAPTVIMDMSDEYSVLSYIYSKDFLTFYFPLRSHASSSFYNYILGSDWEFKALNKTYKSVNESQICNWIFPEYIPKNDKHYTRDKFQLKEDNFVILTIGNNNRLINEELAFEVCRLLEKNPKMVWMFVGEDAPSFMESKYKELFERGQIINHGFEKYLAALCKISNIVLRPNTTGSSGATAIAAQQGLPIVMTNYICDPMRWLGENYTKITNYKDVPDEIYKLYIDKNYYKEKSKEVLEKVNKATDFESAWNELNNIIVEKCNKENK